MNKIVNQEFGGERPLYCARNLYLENVTIHAGESALKETADVTAVGCTFEGKYPFWICNGFTIKNCLFREGARAALWYSRNLEMEDTRVEAPKMFREMDGIKLRRVQRDRVRLGDQRRVPGLAFPRVKAGPMPHHRHPAAVLYRRAHAGGLHLRPGCGPCV